MIRLALLPFALALTLSATAQDHEYKVLISQKLAGEGGWDYLAASSATRRLYIARSGPSGSLHVYDLDTLAPIGEVPVGSAHGAAIDDATHHGFATSNPVTMFDTLTLKVLKTLPTAGNPDGYLLNPTLHQVYILSHVSPNVTVLDTATGAVLSTFNLGGAPEQSVLDAHGHLFIDLEDKDAIAVVDTATLKVTGRYDISSKGGGCAGLAIDTAHDIVFASCRDKKNMIVLSAATGKIITALPTGDGSDGAYFDPATSQVFSTQGEGTLAVIKESSTPGKQPSPADFTLAQLLKTEPRARTLALDEKTGHILTATADFGPTPPLQPGQKSARPPMLPGTFHILVIGK